MPRGPAPKPTKLKLLAGNPGKRALNHAEPQYPVELPSAPRHLSALAKREWRRVGRELVRAGVMTRVDRAVLALYCQAWARWVEAEQKLAKHGAVAETPNGLAVQSVYMQIANRAMEQVRRYAAELGLTPSARTRVHAQQLDTQKSLAEILFEGVVANE